MWLLASIAAHAASPWTLSAELGGEVHPDDPHGIVNVGATRNAFSVRWITDTLDVRWQPEGERGRAWVAGRVATFAAGMVISPWIDGAPALEQGFQGAYAGVEGGGVRYLPHGAYVGAQGHARWHTFYGEGALPVARLHGQSQAILGWWSPWLHAWSVTGVDLQRSPDGSVASVSPHARGQAELTVAWTVAPLLAVRAGWGEDQDVVTLTRLGGLNPYVVPVAGAGWAEWWVEDHAAVRAGAAVQTPRVDVDAWLDAAAFDGPPGAGTAVGLGAGPTVRWPSVDWTVQGGAVPWVPRQEGVARWAAYTLLTLPGTGGDGLSRATRRRSRRPGP